MWALKTQQILPIFLHGAPHTAAHRTEKDSPPRLPRKEALGGRGGPCGRTPDGISGLSFNPHFGLLCFFKALDTGDQHVNSWRVARVINFSAQTRNVDTQLQPTPWMSH